MLGNIWEAGILVRRNEGRGILAWQYTCSAVRKASLLVRRHVVGHMYSAVCDDGNSYAVSQYVQMGYLFVAIGSM